MVKPNVNNSWLIVGLGNPNDLYQKTRHNIGQRFVKWFHTQYNFGAWKNSKYCLAMTTSQKIQNLSIILACPLVFMNESGESVRRLQKFYKISLDHLIVIHDDSDLLFGTFKIQWNRGAAGHKGIISIIDALQTKQFYRIRIGIRSDKNKHKKASDFVLENFTPEEDQIIPNLFIQIANSLEKLWNKF